MTDTADRRSKGRTLIFCAVGLLVLIGALGITHAVRETDSRAAAVADTGKAFLRALGSDDGRRACARMTRTAQSALAMEEHRHSCPGAVDALVGPLDDTERHRLADSYASTFFAREGSFGHVNVRDNPLQITELLLSESQGSWLVAEMK
ncbi:hypothetical protein [Streptomyces sp. NPDC048106]|uniref:hypothetical protein n=1 Tax=Streptomyces sp. NPDC048106 TaxID=3155750 RepID=UPI0034561DE4